MPTSVYPPTLQSTQPAFLVGTSEYPIYFTLASITSFSEIGHIQVRVVYQSSNRSIVNTSRYPDGVIYKPVSSIYSTGSEYYVLIQRSDLSETWQPGYLYKIQVRFGSTGLYNNLSEFASWKQQQIDSGTFSEWSTVMVIKAINDPEVTIGNATSVTSSDITSIEHTEATLTPMFYGSYKMALGNNEVVDQYKFDLYDSEGELLETSGWLQHNSSVSNPYSDDNNASADAHRFKTILQNQESYSVIYSIRTINGYEKSSNAYEFRASRTYLDALENVTIQLDDSSEFCRENGCLRIYCTANDNLSGSFVVTRSDETSNYQVWEDLAFLTIVNQSYNNSLLYTDFTVESGVKYRYALQQENAAGLRTSPIFATIGEINFEYSYLYRDGVQLKFMFNQTLSSFKYTTLRTKQDTLGDRYPHLVQNGDAYYAEFPISGMISFHMDEDQTFFEERDDGYYYRDELVIPSDKFILDNERRNANGTAEIDPSSDQKLVIGTSLTHDNIYVERRFREKVEQFLNDFTYKLYKSPTEGNIVIGLINVSLTPNQTVNRMIYNFSATAYEVLDNTIENLNEVGIINIGSFETLASEDTQLSFGQISGNFSNGTDLYSLIREQEEVSIGDGYKLNLVRITDILIEQYPIVDLNADILELEAKRAEAANAGEPTNEIDAQIAQLTSLIDALQGPTSAVIRLSVNGVEVMVAPNKAYHLNQTINSLSLVASAVPIVVNYVCEVNQVEDTSVGVVEAIDGSRIWGQVYGIFTGTHDVLSTYNWNYRDSPTLRVFSNNGPERLLVRDSMGEVIVDNTTFNVYKTINLYDVIKEEAQKQVESMYGTKFEENEDGQLVGSANGHNVYYTFNDITVFDIEADEGTTLYISSNVDGSNPTTVVIGPTQRYVLNPLDNMIRYIALKDPQFCLINYICLTNQMRMRGE